MAGISAPGGKKLQSDMGVSKWRVLGVACLACFVYLLACGPLGYLTKKGLLSQRFLETLYKPLDLIDGTPARRIIGRYNALWVGENSRCGGIVSPGQSDPQQLQALPVGTNAILDSQSESHLGIRQSKSQ